MGRKKKSEDDIREAMDRGEKEENVYSEVAREDMIDGDEISAEEEGFMKGYDDDINMDGDDDSEEADDDDSEEEY